MPTVLHLRAKPTYVFNRALPLILLIAVGDACNAHDTAPKRTPGPGPEDTAPKRTHGPSLDELSVQIPIPAIPKISTWALDPENSSAAFAVRHVFSKVRGMFPNPSGTVVFDEETPANSRVSATIDVNLVTTGVEERDTHLKTADFFDAANHPTITFNSTTVSRSSATSYSVAGDLTMHGVTRPVTLDVAVSPPFDHAGGIRRGIEATTTVDRRDFGLLWEFPGEKAVVGDSVEITVNAELVLQTEPGNGS